jgi:hypothetical protein
MKKDNKSQLAHKYVTRVLRRVAGVNKRLRRFVLRFRLRRFPPLSRGCF